MEKFFVLALAFVSVMFFMYGYQTSKAFYYRKHQTKYNLKQMFPYEFNYPDNFNNNKYGNIFFILSWVGVIAIYLFNFLFRPHASAVIGIASLCLAIALTILAMVILLVPLNHLRVHMVASSIFLVLATGLPAFNCLTAYQEFSMATDKMASIISIAALVIGVLQTAIMLLCVLNPRATYKIYMEKEVTPDGEEVLKRPKTIALAFSEWIALITFVLSPLPVVLLFFL
ncbi:MAG: hypothetical protein GX813_04435 [Erysipelotrichia bacterium]|nr:hypothetical protein [Erysipelotrichia bacterium]